MPAQYKNPPIERHPALQPLSRDHYGGLVQARHLVQAADADDVARRKAVAEFVDAWDREIAEHFHDEQCLLEPLMEPADRERLRAEHESLTDLAEQARSLRRTIDPDAAVLRALGERLEAHIRWEERELFNRVQQRASEPELAELRKRTDEIERRRARDACRGPARSTPHEEP